MTTNPEGNTFSDPNPPIDSNSLKLDSLKFWLLDRWIALNIVEVPSARLPLKTAYTFYLIYCYKEELPCVPIQAFNRTLQVIQASRWPSARKRRSARGILYENLTLRAWVPERIDSPQKGGGASSNEEHLCPV